MRNITRKVILTCLVWILFLTGGNAMIAEAKAGAEENLLSYLVVENAYVEIPGEQKIVVAIGSEETLVADAVLNYRNNENGQIYSQSVERIVENTILFSIQFENPEQEGIYELESISCVIDGRSKTIDLAVLGKNVVFGVNREVDVSADAYIVDEELAEENIEANVITFDEEGKQSSEVSIVEAMQNAISQNDMVSNGDIVNRAIYNSKGFVIVLDPGHGGKDPGAVRTYNGITYYERDIVLKIAEYCKAELEKTPGITVYLTRTNNTDALMDRKERTDYAMSVGANVIVSLHINATASEVTSVSGALVYCPQGDTESGEISRALADEILKKLEALGLKNRGKLVDEGLGMIKYPKEYGVPGILIEHAFINNPSDVADYLSTDEQLKKLGQADAKGILEYFSPELYSTMIFDAEYYASLYSDLRRAFGDNEEALLNHFIKYGIQEGRCGSRIFDVKFYMSKYPEIAQECGNDYVKLYNHFVTTGMSNGLQGSTNFDVYSYVRQYSDLRSVYKNNLRAYYEHYLKHGAREGRRGTGCSEMQNLATVYEGVDYAAVYDYNYYINRYENIKDEFGWDDQAVLKHFVLYGMQDGQQGSASFDVNSYRRQYADLRRVYGEKLKNYYNHYINYGKKEGRAGTGCVTVQGATTTYNGVDYSSVYNYYYYTNAYADIKQAYGDDDEAIIKHFVTYGMKEGRQGNENFNVRSYKNRYTDLQSVFGDELPKYYNHYIKYGIREGRVGN